MKSSNKKKHHPIERVFNALSVCSLSCLFRFAKILAWGVARSKNRISKQTRLNVTLCVTDKAKQSVFYKTSIHHTVCSLIEMASIWQQPIIKVLAHIKTQKVCDAYQTDHGAKIIVAPHFGSWEILTYWLAEQGSLYALYKPARSLELDNYILIKRTRNGAILVPTNLAGLRALLKGLKAGATVMVLPDQKPSAMSAKIDAKFYGYEASTSLLIKSLAKKVNCSVYMAAAVRNLKHAQYSIHLKELSRASLTAEDQQSADYLNQSIEQFIAIDEAQYQWSYRRFPDALYEQLNHR